MKILIRKFYLFLTIILFLSTPSFATKKFTIGVENLNYYPLYSWDGKTYSGFAREFLDMFAKSKGYTFKYHGLPIKRLYKSLFKQQVDFKFPDSPYWLASQKKGKRIQYSDGIVDFIDGVMVLPENKRKGISHLKTLGIVRGFTAWDYLDHINSGKIKILENNSFEGLLKQVIKKRVCGAYVNITVSNYIIEKHLNKKNALVFAPILPHTKSSYQISTLKYPKVIKELNTYMKNNFTKIQKLKDKHNVSIDY